LENLNNSLKENWKIVFANTGLGTLTAEDFIK